MTVREKWLNHLSSIMWLAVCVWLLLLTYLLIDFTALFDDLYLTWDEKLDNIFYCILANFQLFFSEMLRYNYRVSCFLLVFFKWVSKSNQGLMILDVEHVQKVWTFNFIQLVLYLISKLCEKWPICLLLNQVFYK